MDASTTASSRSSVSKDFKKDQTSTKDVGFDISPEKSLYANRMKLDLEKERTEHKAMRVKFRKLNQEYISSAANHQREMLALKKSLEEKEQVIERQRVRQQDLIANQEKLKRVCGIAAETIRNAEEKSAQMEVEVARLKERILEWEEIGHDWSQQKEHLTEALNDAQRNLEDHSREK